MSGPDPETEAPPRRFKSIEELSPAEHFQRKEAAHKGEPEPQFERDAYRAYRARVLENAGLELDAADVQAVGDEAE